VASELSQEDEQKIPHIVQALEKYEMDAISVRFQNDVRMRVVLDEVRYLLLVLPDLQLLPAHEAVISVHRGNGQSSNGNLDGELECIESLERVSHKSHSYPL
jgi:hypothetical protein